MTISSPMRSPRARTRARNDAGDRPVRIARRRRIASSTIRPAPAVRGPPQLGLEDDDEREKADHGARLEDARQESKVEGLGGNVDRVEHDRADDESDRAGALNEAEKPVKEQRRERDIEDCRRFDVRASDQVLKLLHRRAIVVAARNPRQPPRWKSAEPRGALRPRGSATPAGVEAAVGVCCAARGPGRAGRLGERSVLVNAQQVVQEQHPLHGPIQAAVLEIDARHLEVDGGCAERKAECALARFERGIHLVALGVAGRGAHVGFDGLRRVAVPGGLSAAATSGSGRPPMRPPASSGMASAPGGLLRLEMGDPVRARGRLGSPARRGERGGLAGERLAIIRRAAERLVVRGDASWVRPELQQYAAHADEREGAVAGEPGGLPIVLERVLRPAPEGCDVALLEGFLVASKTASVTVRRLGRRGVESQRRGSPSVRARESGVVGGAGWFGLGVAGSLSRTRGLRTGFDRKRNGPASLRDRRSFCAGKRLALGVLRRLAGSLEAVLLALLHARVAREEAGLAERRRAPSGSSRAARGRCHGGSRRPGLVAAAFDLDHRVVAALGPGDPEGHQDLGSG